MHLNIHSLSAKFEQLKQIMCQLQDQNIYLDAVLLCETFLHEGNANLFNIEGYHFEYRNRTQMSRGGVAIYIRNNISYAVRNDLSKFIEGEFESLFIEAIIHGKTIIMDEIYRTPASYANKSVEYLENTVEKLKRERQVILATDYNFCISKPTRITEHSQRLIDNIYK